ncbi:winged helix-turn-helix domain-containing protein [Sandarakinorhabdus rubra]|uniref:winged helix-turn-helix domain-containing protein n=1 Tax=Sandarakinorhabdus rubra TaxID=2672568 RepID=UPI0013DD2A79|nr:LysR family transcriptional regulator [Sandarakinorhabdus rubra]
MSSDPPATGRLKIKAQLLVGAEIALGPGKADLLDAIAVAGSISAAARVMGLSYRRAWLMVDAMNRMFAEPLVATHAGSRSGARLTAAGAAVLADYRALDAALAQTAATAGAALLGRIKASPSPL